MSRKKTLDAAQIVGGADKPLKIILTLAWPLLIEQFMSSLVSYADTAMVGALGSYATASVTISNSPNFLINGAIMALGTGVTALVARNIGARRDDEAKRVVRHALILLSTLGVFLWGLMLALHRAIPAWMGAGDDIIEYASKYNLVFNLGRIFMMTTTIISSALRGAGDTKTPLMVNSGVNIINVVGNFLLIQPTREIGILSLRFTMWGAGLGVVGAAAASAFSMFCGGVAMLCVLFTRDTAIRISVKDSFRPDGALMRNIISISIPAMFERFCTSGAGIVVTASIAKLGTDYISANSLQLTAESMSYMPAFAFAGAATTLVGQSLGAGRPDLARKYNWTTIKFSMVLMCFAGAGLYFAAEWILGIFTPDAHVIEIAAKCLHIVAFAQPIQVFTWVLAGSLRGAGDTKWTFYITAITTWCVRVLGSVLCLEVFGLSLPSCIACAGVENLVRGILLFIRFQSGKWADIYNKK